MQPSGDGERFDDDRKSQKEGDGRGARRLMHLITMRLCASADSVCSSLIVDGKQLGYNVCKRIDKICI